MGRAFILFIFGGLLLATAGHAEGGHAGAVDQLPIPSPVPVRDTAAPKVITDSEIVSLINAAGRSPEGTEFLEAARKTLAIIAYRADLNKLSLEERVRWFSLTLTKEGLSLSAPQLTQLGALIILRDVPAAQLYQIMDVRQRGKDAVHSETMRAVASNQAQWLEKQDEALLDTLTNQGKWQQVTRTNAEAIIDTIRRARAAGNTAAEIQSTVSYLLLLTPEQREIFEDKIFPQLAAIHPGMWAYPATEALAHASRAYHFFTAGQPDPTPSDYSAPLVAELQRRSDSSRALHKATHEYVKKDGESYVFNPEKKAAFDAAVGSFSADQLLAFGAGLGANEKQREYGERLLLGLTLKDGEGNRVLPTQKNFSEHEGAVDAENGGVVVAHHSHGNKVPVSYVREALSAWDHGKGKTPRSHYHVYQKLENAEALVPKASESPREVWIHEGGQLKAIRLAPNTAGGTPPEPERVVDELPKPQVTPPPASKSVKEEVPAPTANLLDEEVKQEKTFFEEQYDA